jgi:hypothetical protein
MEWPARYQNRECRWGNVTCVQEGGAEPRSKSEDASALPELKENINE